MYHLKYYVIFMMGIFLSLGIGIMIGITIESKDILDRQQSQLVKQIEESFISLRKESSKLKEKNESLGLEVDRYRDISNILLTETVKQKLTGLNVAVIDFNKNYKENIVSFINTTGAMVSGYIEVNYKSSQGLDIDHLAAFIETKIDSIAPIVAQDIVYSLISGEVNSFIQELQNIEFINFSTDLQGIPAHVILLIPDNELAKVNDRYDILLIEAALGSEVPVVVLESTDFKESLIPQYLDYGVSSVDHIDTLYGKLSLVSILTGNKGNYGVRKNTDGMVPDPLFIDFAEANN